MFVNVKKLTGPQLEVLRKLPLDGRPNRLRLALSIVGAKQIDLVEATGLTQPHVSNIMRGRFETITLDTARLFCDALGCENIDDLFPREGVAA